MRSAPMPTSASRVGRPSDFTKSRITSQARAPGRPSFSATVFWRSALTGSFHSQRGGKRDAGRDAVRHARVAAEYVADAVARTVRNEGRGGDLRQPRRELAVQARLQVVGARLDRRHVRGEHLHGLQREPLARADAGGSSTSARPRDPSPACRSTGTAPSASRASPPDRVITAAGAIRGWRKCILTLRWTSVIPAPAVNSAADKVVGTAVMRIRSRVERARGAARRASGESVDSVSTSRTPRHSAICMVLVASITEPPPTASR